MQQLMKYNSNSKCENGSNETLFEMWQRWLPWKLHRTDWFNFSQIEKKRMSVWGLRRAWQRKGQMRVTSQCGCHARHRSSINNRPRRCNQQQKKQSDRKDVQQIFFKATMCYLFTSRFVSCGSSGRTPGIMNFSL